MLFQGSTAPETTEITVIFDPHMLLNCSRRCISTVSHIASPWYCYHCELSHLLLEVFLPTLSTTTMSRYFTITCLSVCTWKSHRILAQPLLEVCRTLTCPNLVQMFQYTMPQLLVGLASYTHLPASIIMCRIISGVSLHSLYLASCLVWWIPGSSALPLLWSFYSTSGVADGW